MNLVSKLLIFIIASFVLFLFTRCTPDPAIENELCWVCGEHYAHERWRLPAHPFHIREFERPFHGNRERDFLGNYPFTNQEEQQKAVQVFLNNFETVHTFTYIHPRLSRHGEALYDTVILWSDEVIRDFTFMSIETDNLCDDYDGWRRHPYGHVEVLFTIDELQPGSSIALNLSFNAFERPSAGLVFTDKKGVERRMWMSYGAKYFCHAFYHIWLYDETPWVNIDWVEN